MKAFNEFIHGGLVRVGPHCRQAPDPYLFSATYDFVGEWAVVKGFHWPNLGHRDGEVIVKTINDATGKLVAFTRERDGNPTILVQIDPKLIRGRIAMRPLKEGEKL